MAGAGRFWPSPTFGVPDERPKTRLSRNQHHQLESTTLAICCICECTNQCSQNAAQEYTGGDLDANIKPNPSAHRRPEDQPCEHHRPAWDLVAVSARCIAENIDGETKFVPARSAPRRTVRSSSDFALTAARTTASGQPIRDEIQNRGVARRDGAAVFTGRIVHASSRNESFNEPSRSFAQAVEELVGPDQQTISIDGWASVEQCAVFQLITGQLLELGFGRDDERHAIPSRIVDPTVRQQG